MEVKRHFQHNPAVFSAATDSENKVLKCYAEKDKNIFESPSLGQEPTVKNGTKYYRTNSLHSATGYLSGTGQLTFQSFRLIIRYRTISLGGYLCGTRQIDSQVLNNHKF